MDPYFAFFLAGCAGLSLMAALGAAGNHGHHASGHSAHGAEGFHLHGTGGHGTHLHSETSFHHTPAAQGVHGHAAHGHAAHGHGAHANHHGHHAQNQNGNSREASNPIQAQGNIYTLRGFVLGWLSPRVLFTLAMGSGAAGLCVAQFTTVEPVRGIISLAGGVALEKLVVAPLWNALTRFASSPARTLESAVFEEAVAVTPFDAEGCGVVSVTLDGHEMKLLGRLSAENWTRRVRSGEALLIESVDSARGQCVVSPLETSPPESKIAV